MPLNETDIRWTDYTLNWVHGCSKTSEGCANCYAERVSRRFGHTDYPWTEEHAAENVQLKPDVLDESSFHVAVAESADLQELRETLGWRDEDGNLETLVRGMDATDDLPAYQEADT